MHRALWFLTWLRFKGWLRRLARGMRTVKGALMASIGVIVIGSCLASWLFSLVVSTSAPDAPERLEQFRRYGPLGLLAMCLLTLLTSSGERAVVPFSPAEVNFLFSGPFSRRQLLAYRLMINFLSVALGAAFFLMWSSYMRLGNVPVLARYLGLVLALSFVQLFTIVLGFTASAIGVQAYNRWRKIVLALLLGLALLVVLRAGNDFFRQNPRDMLVRIEQSPIVQTVLEPLRWFIMAVTADRLWPDFARWAGLSLLADLGMLILAFALDAHYLESAAAASERLYAQIQRVRRGGAAAATLGTSGTVRFSLPSLPWWGGVGPMAWRQMLAVPRSRATVVFLIILVPLLAIPLFPGLSDASHDRKIPVFLGGQVIAITIFMSGLFAFDFRGDVERMDMLKTLPIAPVPLAIGQLVTPALFISSIQAIALGIMAATVKPESAFRFAVALPFVIPFNFLLCGVDNLLFLYFPSKTVNVSPGDFQSMGRYALLNLARFLVVGVTLGVATVLALAVYFISSSIAAALALGWLVLAGFAAALVPFIALAFRRFDVARDTPPE